MFHQITYQVGKTTKALKLDENQAKKVREVMASGDVGAFITLGLETIQVRNIRSLTAEDTSTGKGSIRDMRRRMITAALNCFLCKGEGFSTVFLKEDGGLAKTWEPKSTEVKELCQCQTKIKQGSGIAVDDFSWNHQDTE